MKISRRILPAILLMGFLLLLGLVSAPFFQDNLITPIALVLWLFWRILQSVDQAVYWGLLILGIVVYLFARLFLWLQEPTILERPSTFGSNATLEKINYWWLAIRFAERETNSNILKQDLGKLLATLYASKQPETVQFEIYDALEQRRISLPEPVYAFLFPPKPARARRWRNPFSADLRSAWRERIFPPAWVSFIRRGRRRETAEYYQTLESVITFMEASLETRHDDEQFDSTHH